MKVGESCQDASKLTDELVQTNFARFVAVLYQLVVERGNRFDFVLGAGSSGLAMTAFTEMFYDEVVVECPPIVLVPIVRFRETEVGEYFDNSVLVPMLSKQLERIERFQNVLFVDDEIHYGFVAKTSLELVLQSVPKKKTPATLEYTIIAEDRGFEFEYCDISPHVTVRFYPFATGTSSIYNVLLYNIPADLCKEVQLATHSCVNSKELLGLVLTGFAKEIVGGGPVFTKKYVSLLYNYIPDFDAKRQAFIDGVRSQIRTAIERYRKVDITLQW
jgi:hypothetical protein